MKNNFTKLGMVLILTLCFLSCQSKAQSKEASSQEEPKNHEHPSIEEIMEKMDADKDGQLTKEEIKGPLQRDFSKIDTNEDGFLTKEELENAPKPERKGPPNEKRQ
ncbi:hypothetical protein GCM10022393_38820 [Aquimarina addita]|uniref:EF-hand domain-containing protein n=1 Tax=Aquimarina addita TaxID=870485 RepID=A0ABP6UUY4_9FLAO